MENQDKELEHKIIIDKIIAMLKGLSVQESICILHDTRAQIQEKTKV